MRNNLLFIRHRSCNDKNIFIKWKPATIERMLIRKNMVDQKLTFPKPPPRPPGHHRCPYSLPNRSKAIHDGSELLLAGALEQCPAVLLVNDAPGVRFEDVRARPFHPTE
mmetsp:Transcript_37656/g.80409  ORF Transcript_37656/g.80409 Transcript_37656/m.80409 type:complete len:109 (-) Transcript_37656:200-526(-)